MAYRWLDPPIDFLSTKREISAEAAIRMIEICSTVWNWLTGASEFWAGIFGAVLGSIITITGQYFAHRWQTAEARDRDNKRKELLRQMLDNPGPEGWRKMATLSGVVGASREETARLLIEIGARSSEKEKDVWAYIKNKPLPSPQ